MNQIILSILIFFSSSYLYAGGSQLIEMEASWTDHYQKDSSPISNSVLEPISLIIDNQLVLKRFFFPMGKNSIFVFDEGSLGKQITQSQFFLSKIDVLCVADNLPLIIQPGEKIHYSCKNGKIY